MTDVPGRRHGPPQPTCWHGTALGHALLAGHVDVDAPSRPADRPNLTRMLFLDPHTRDLYADWGAEAALAVASLRLVAGQLPRRPRAWPNSSANSASTALSSRRLWAQASGAAMPCGVKRFRHPEVGEFDLDFEVLELGDESAHRILTYTAIPGTPSQAALQLLATSSEPTSSEPILSESTSLEPMSLEPMSLEPMSSKPMSSRPMSSKPMRGGFRSG